MQRSKFMQICAVKISRDSGHIRYARLRFLILQSNVLSGFKELKHDQLCCFSGRQRQWRNANDSTTFPLAAFLLNSNSIQSVFWLVFSSRLRKVPQNHQNCWRSFLRSANVFTLDLGSSAVDNVIMGLSVFNSKQITHMISSALRFPWNNHNLTISEINITFLHASHYTTAKKTKTSIYISHAVLMEPDLLGPSNRHTTTRHEYIFYIEIRFNLTKRL